VENAIKDLTQWGTFALAGRLQKPVLPFLDESDEVAKAIETNRYMALNLAVMLHYN